MEYTAHCFVETVEDAVTTMKEYSEVLYKEGIIPDLVDEFTFVLNAVNIGTLSLAYDPPYAIFDDNVEECLITKEDVVTIVVCCISYYYTTKNVSGAITAFEAFTCLTSSFTVIYKVATDMQARIIITLHALSSPDKNYLIRLEDTKENRNKLKTAKEEAEKYTDNAVDYCQYIWNYIYNPLANEKYKKDADNQSNDNGGTTQNE